MAEPLTIGALAVAGLTWVLTDASGAAGGVAGAVATDAVKAIGCAVRDRIAGWRGLPENEHVARATRRAQMHALERSLREWRETLLPQWHRLDPDTRRFCDDAIAFCASTLGRCADPGLKLNGEVTEPLAATLNGLLAETPPGSPAHNRAATLAEFAEDTVLAELRERLPGLPIPPEFERHFRQGDGQGRARFLGLFGHYIADEIKNNVPFRTILTQGQLASIEALGFDTTEMLHRIEQRFGDVLKEIATTVTRIETEQQRRDRLDAERFEALMASVALKNGVPPEKLRPMFAHLGQDGLTDAQIIEKAEEGIAAILDIARARPAMPPNAGADIAQVLATAQAQLGAIDTDAALATLDASLAEEREAQRRRMVPVLRMKAGIHRATYDHAAAMAALEELLRLDPDAVWDWIALGDLRRTTGSLRSSREAYDAALAAARRHDPAGRDVGAVQVWIGDVLLAQGDLAGALAAFRAYRAIAERLATADPANAGWQRDLSVSHERIGDVLRAQGDGAGALAAYRARHAIIERLAAADPANAEWQRDLSVSHNKIGDVLRAQGDGAGALAAYRDAMAIAERLAAADPANAEWQRDLIVSCAKLAEAEPARAVAWWGRALAVARALEASGRLAPVDAWMPEDIARRLRQAGGAPD